MKAWYYDEDGNWVSGTVTISIDGGQTFVDPDELPDTPVTRMINASERDLLDRYKRGEFDG